MSDQDVLKWKGVFQTLAACTSCSDVAWYLSYYMSALALEFRFDFWNALTEHSHNQLSLFSIKATIVISSWDISNYWLEAYVWEPIVWRARSTDCRDWRFRDDMFKWLMVGNWKDIIGGLESQRVANGVVEDCRLLRWVFVEDDIERRVELEEDQML